MNTGRRSHLKLPANLGDGGWFLIRLDVSPNEIKNSSLLGCYGHITSSPFCPPKNKFSLTTENHANILEHMERDVKWFFTGPGAVAWGRPLRPPVLASRRDSSPVID